MEKLDACCISNEHSASRADSLKDGFYLNDELWREETCLCFYDQDYFEKIKEFHLYLDTVKKIVKPGCSQKVLDVALNSMSSLVQMLSMMSSGPYPLASL